MAKKQSKTPPPILTWTLVFVALLVLFNQWQIFTLHSLLGVKSTGALSLARFAPTFAGGSDGVHTILGPILLAAGEQPVLPGYGTKIKELPTISSNAQKSPTGDAVQDLINTLIPTGTPEYGIDIGVTFDDPITALKKWGQIERSTKLQDPTAEERWKKVTSSFTCDFCCGSPSQPTRITQCGCSHAAAWRGIAKFIIAKYGDKYSDEQILGELTRWKALWYPGPVVKRIIQEQQAGGTDAASKVDAAALGDLPGMVGGC